MICEHGNEITPALAKAFCNMPPAWYKRVSVKIKPDVCLFITEREALEKKASSTKKGK